MRCEHDDCFCVVEYEGLDCPLCEALASLEDDEEELNRIADDVWDLPLGVIEEAADDTRRYLDHWDELATDLAKVTEVIRRLEIVRDKLLAVREAN